MILEFILIVHVSIFYTFVIILFLNWQTLCGSLPFHGNNFLWILIFFSHLVGHWKSAFFVVGLYLHKFLIVSLVFASLLFYIELFAFFFFTKIIFPMLNDLKSFLFFSDVYLFLFLLFYLFEQYILFFLQIIHFFNNSVSWNPFKLSFNFYLFFLWRISHCFCYLSPSTIRYWFFYWISRNRGIFLLNS